MRTHVLFTVLLLVPACKYEGDEPEECSDGADNDRDGLFDCDDEGCVGAPECSDTDTASETDSDTDTDSDTGTDSDTDTDTDSDTDPDTDTDTDSDTDTFDRYAVDTASGRLRFVHLMSDSSSVDMVLNGGPSIYMEDLPYPGTIAYAPFSPGSYDIQFNSTGTTDNLVLAAGTPLAAGSKYSIVLFGTVAGGAIDSAVGPQSIRLLDDIIAPSPGMARLRPVNLAGTTHPDGLTVWGDGTELYDLAFGQAGIEMEVAAGDITWGVDTDGDDTPDTTFLFTVADGDTANVYLAQGSVLVGDPVVENLFVHHTTSLPSDHPQSYFSSNEVIQVVPVYPTTP